MVSGRYFSIIRYLGSQTCRFHVFLHIIILTTTEIVTHWESETESGLHERSDIRTRIFDEFVKNNWPDNDKFQFKNANYNLENVELKKYFRPNHMYPRKMPKKGKDLPENPLLKLNLFTEIPRSTLVKKSQIESWIFFQNFIFRILFNDDEIFWNGSYDLCLLQFWSNCNFECRLRVVAASFEEELREHFEVSDCELFVPEWLV